MEYIIVGLGNPGTQYADTRHNIGRFVVERFQKDVGCASWEKRDELKAFMSRGMMDEHHVTLLEPDNFMNNSGWSVARYVREVDEPNIIIVHDDLDLPLGSIRLSHNRGSGGHNGVKSIEQALKTKEFTRLRVGISPVGLLGGGMKKPRGERAVQNFVLKKFGLVERNKLGAVVKDASDALQMVVGESLEKAMNTYNS